MGEFNNKKEQQMKVRELIEELSKVDPELTVAVPKFDFPNDKYVYPKVRVEEMVISAYHLTTREHRPGAAESRGMHCTLGAATMDCIIGLALVLVPLGVLAGLAWAWMAQGQ